MNPGDLHYEKFRQEGLAAVIQAARESNLPSTLDPDLPQMIIVPQGSTLEIPNLRAWQETPSRKQGTYLFATVDSFIAYVTDQKSDDETTVWVHPTSGRTVAVINDNGAAGGLPGWGDHRAELQLEVTPEWKYWTAENGVSMNQTEFAEHIEGGLREIVSPVAADVLELAQSFHAKSSASFRQSTRLHSGEQRLQYDEEIDAKAGASGDMLVPTEFELGIAPFVGSDPYKVVARFRFRLNAGKLTLRYNLDRPDEVVRAALADVAEKLSGAFGKVYIGQPTSL